MYLFSPLRHGEHRDIVFFICRETAANEKNQSDKSGQEYL